MLCLLLLHSVNGEKAPYLYIAFAGCRLTALSYWFIVVKGCEIIRKLSLCLTSDFLYSLPGWRHVPIPFVRPWAIMGLIWPTFSLFIALSLSPMPYSRLSDWLCLTLSALLHGHLEREYLETENVIVLRNTRIAGSLVALPCSLGSVTRVAKGCLTSRCGGNLFTQILFF